MKSSSVVCWKPEGGFAELAVDAVLETVIERKLSVDFSLSSPKKATENPLAARRFSQ